MSKNKSMLNTAEVSLVLGKSERWVRFLLTNAVLKGIKVGRDWVIMKEELDKYINHRKKLLQGK